MRLAALFVVLCKSYILFAQSPDSLLKKLASATQDTAKINLLNKLTDHYLGDKNDSAKYFNEASLKLSTRKHLEKYSFDGLYYRAQLKKLDGKYDQAHAAILHAARIARLNGNGLQEAKTMRLTGSLFDAEHKEKQAIEKYLQALQLCRSIKNKEGILASNMSLGLYFKKHNEATNALKYFLEANKLAHEMNDSSALFTCVINLGTMYEVTKDKAKALNFYRQAMLINEKDHDENGQAISTFKIGRLYYTMGMKDSARFFLKQTLAIHLKNKQERGLIFDYAYLGTTYDEEGDLKKAYDNWNMALVLGKKFSDSGRVNMVYSYMAGSELRRKNYKKALEYFDQCLLYATSTLSNETMAVLYERMSIASEKLGKYKQAYDYHVLCKTFSDSSKNVSETKKQTELKLGYEFNEVQEKLLAESEAKELENQLRMDKQTQERNFLLIGLGLISLFFVVAVRSSRMKRKANALLEKQKLEIEHQKKLVEQKNHEISDSINYALHIQTASLPEEKELAHHFEKHALFFKPKDIVSGDFYWAAGDAHQVIIAIADCTGHGVPGAITSIIGSMLLNEIYYVKKLIYPDAVLKELNRLVKLTLRQETDSSSKDGMDIAFCLWDKKTNKLLYSGANRPIYILRNKQLTEYKPTKVSVGGYVPLLQNYDLNEIDLLPGDTLVMTSDGYADQFGGRYEKKFTSKAFKDLLKEIAPLSLAEKMSNMEQRFTLWQRDLEQTDDVLVFMLEV